MTNRPGGQTMWHVGAGVLALLLGALVVPVAVRAVSATKCGDVRLGWLHPPESSGPEGLWVMDADGARERHLGDAVKGNLVLSPDGSRFADVSADRELFVVNVDGSGRRSVVPAPVYMPADPSKEWPGTWTGEFVSSPAWSPDGERLVFSADGSRSGTRVHDGMTGDFEDTELYAMKLDGSERVQLTDDDQHNTWPAWSPDGTKIAFLSGNTSIEIVNADGSGRRVISDKDTTWGDPAWSPDGTRIVFRSAHHDDDGWISEVELDGLRHRSLTRAHCGDSDPAWSPQGDRIAIASGGIALIDPDGSNRRQLTKGHDYAPTWSPDGKQIFFLRTDPTAGMRSYPAGS